MRTPPRPGFLLVATRELRWMRRDRVALFLALGVPIIAFTILSLIFSNAVIRNLRVSVVDADRSPTSLTYVQAIASAPGVSVAERSSDMTSATHAIRSGDAIAAVYIPENFERDLVAGRRPQIVAFYNRQYFTPGNSASAAISNAIAAATATLPRTSNSESYAPGPLMVEQYVLTNPALNYAQFLLRAILPTVLHVVVAIAAGYAVGSEFSRRSLRAWLRAAGGSPLTALVGKLAPLLAIFVMMMVVDAGIIHSVYGVPFRGDSVLMGAAACLLVIAYLSLGSLLQLLTRDLAVGLSLTAIFCNPAFGFAGVGFPLLAMGGFARFWGRCCRCVGTSRSCSTRRFADCRHRAPPNRSSSWARLASRCSASPGCACSAIVRTVTRRVPEPPAAEPAFAGVGIGGAMFAEMRRILNDRGVFGLIVMAPLSTVSSIRNPISASCCATYRLRSSTRITPSLVAISLRH